MMREELISVTIHILTLFMTFIFYNTLCAIEKRGLQRPALIAIPYLFMEVLQFLRTRAYRIIDLNQFIIIFITVFLSLINFQNSMQPVVGLNFYIAVLVVAFFIFSTIELTFHGQRSFHRFVENRIITLFYILLLLISFEHFSNQNYILDFYLALLYFIFSLRILSRIEMFHSGEFSRVFNFLFKFNVFIILLNYYLLSHPNFTAEISPLEGSALFLLYSYLDIYLNKRKAEAGEKIRSSILKRLDLQLITFLILLRVGLWII